METIQHDVLLIGGGAAGLRAAIAAVEARPGLRVGVVSKVYPMRSHTVAAEGGAAAVVLEEDTLETHAWDTVSGGDWLSDQDAVEAFVREAPGELLRLENWGCPWSRTPEGRVAVRPFGGMKLERTWFAADRTGFHLLHTLYQTVLSYRDVVFHDEWFVTRLLVDEGRCHGAVAVEMASGRVYAIRARAVVLCTGGAGKAYRYTTNGVIKTGDGMALAYRAGVPLKDMEFVQYHPTGLPFTGILITEAARAEGGWLLNRDGYRYLQDYDLGRPDPRPVKRSMELGPRDRLSQAFVEELRRGRTVETRHGHVVHLDLRHLGETVLDERLPFVRELCLRYERIDPAAEPIPVRPVVHYMMGGVHTDIRGATPLRGLYAAGEVACVSINGANRLGSNSLTECLVFGARAGSAAAEETLRGGPPPGPALEMQARDEERRLEGGTPARGAGRERLAELRQALQDVMEEAAGIYRDAPGLHAAAGTVGELRERMDRVSLDDRSLTFNTERLAFLEMENLLDVSEAVLHSGLHREESRGAHQRTDFPERDDERFLAHSLAWRVPGGAPRLELLPVTVTRWPPGERVYGR